MAVDSDLIELSPGTNHRTHVDLLAGHSRRIGALDVSGCTALTDLSGLKHAPSMVRLELARCRALEDLSPIAHLQQLEELSLAYCESVTDISVLTELPNLKRLDLQFCEAIENLEVLEQLDQLEQLVELDLRGLPQLEDLSFLEACENLEDLDVAENPQIPDLSPLAALSNLRRLDVRYARDARGVESLSALTNLGYLAVDGIDGVETLDFARPLDQLIELHFVGCANLTDITALGGKPRLTKLKVKKCPGFQSLDVPDLPEVESLVVDDCEALEKLSIAGRLPSLESLYISGCTELVSVEGVESLPKLSSLTVNYAPSLEELGSLDGLPELEEVQLSDCRLADLDNFDGLPALRKLRCVRLRSLEDIGGLEGAPRLRDLRLESCPKLRSVTSIRKLEHLEQFRVTSRSKLDLAPDKRGLEGREEIGAFQQKLRDFCVQDASEQAETTDQSNGTGLERGRKTEIKERLTKIRKLIHHDDAKFHRQGIDLARALGDEDVLEKMFEGTEFLEGRTDPSVQPGSFFLRSGRALDGPLLQAFFELARCLDGDHPVREGLREVKHFDWEPYRHLESLDSLDFVELMPNLERLTLEKQPAVEDLSALADHTALERLDLTGCANLADISGVGELEDVLFLSVSGCGALTDISPVAALDKLQNLWTSHTPTEADTETFAALDNLDILNLDDTDIQDLNCLPGMNSLRILRIQGATRLASLEGIENVPNLEHLTLSKCPALSAADLERLERLEDLRKLELLDMNLQNLDFAAMMPALGDLCLREWSGLENVDGLLEADELSLLRVSLPESLPVEAKHKRLNGERLERYKRRIEKARDARKQAEELADADDDELGLDPDATKTAVEKRVREIRKLLHARQQKAIAQGLQLALASDHDEVIRQMLEGAEIDDEGRVEPGKFFLHRGQYPDHDLLVGLYLLLFLLVDTSEHPLVGEFGKMKRLTLPGYDFFGLLDELRGTDSLPRPLGDIEHLTMASFSRMSNYKLFDNGKGASRERTREFAEAFEPLEDLEALVTLPSLRVLRLRRLPYLSALDGVEDQPNLESLLVFACRRLEDKSAAKDIDSVHIVRYP